MVAAYVSAQYQEMQVQTSPGKQVVMLYDGGLRFLHMGMDAMRRGDRVTQSVNLGKAQNIVMYLMNTLDMSAGPIAHNLNAIYTYWLRRLMTANVEDDARPVEEVIRHMESLRDAWEQADRITRGGIPVEAAGVLVGAGR